MLSSGEDKIPVTVTVKKGEYTVTFGDTTVTVCTSGESDNNKIYVRVHDYRLK